MKLGGIFDLEQKAYEIKVLEEKTLKNGFWNDKNKSSKTIKELNILKGIVEEYKKLSDNIDELEVLIEFVEAGEDEFKNELEVKFKTLIRELDSFDTALLLDGEFDENGAIFTIHAGAGGTESCDWAEMLYRMYSRWFNSKGYKVEELDYQAGDTVGIKSITLLVSGLRAYGYLKGEKGVHRLVRISPFDAAKKRHTSFASIDVTPEIDDTINIEVKACDLKVDTFRAGGAGGQHVNTTDSAVRMTHIPTGVIVGCQSGRSQLQNRETALKMLKSKLLEIEMKKREDELKKLHGEQSDNSWGNQIRSYVFQPYTMVKDHRTSEEIGNVKAVMDGEIDSFITAYLRWMKK
ncbi:MAG: peptide chain release factor 2 [Psychrilyobacter sp.]|nr:peptide chain release factor 2 [Psychrilyobacter sp.]